MLGGQGEQLSSAHPLEPGEPGVEGECVAVPGTGVLPGAEHCCRPTAGDFYRQAESHIMTFKRFPGQAAAEQGVFGLPRYSLKPRGTGF